MQTLCRGSCPEIAELGTLIDRQVAMQDAQKVKDLAAVTGIPTAPGTVPAPESKP
jgi:hypothetical protein